MRRNVLDRMLGVLAIEPKDHILIPVTGIFSGKKTNRTQSNFNTFPWRTPIKSTELSHYQLCFKSMVQKSGLNKKTGWFFLFWRGHQKIFHRISSSVMHSTEPDSVKLTQTFFNRVQSQFFWKKFKPCIQSNEWVIRMRATSTTNCETNILSCFLVWQALSR